MSRHDQRVDHTGDIAASRILEALINCYADCPDDPETLITQALCDLRHLCDQRALHFAACDKAGNGLYLNERHGRGS